MFYGRDKTMSLLPQEQSKKSELRLSVCVVDLPWLVLCGILDELEVRDMMAFIRSSKQFWEYFWNDDVFWECQFKKRFGCFKPSCFKSSWRDAFVETYSRGTSYISEEASRSATNSESIFNRFVGKTFSLFRSDQGNDIWETVLIGVLGIRGSGKTRMLRVCF